MHKKKESIRPRHGTNQQGWCNIPLSVSQFADLLYEQVKCQNVAFITLY